jgi:hypothetical protein
MTLKSKCCGADVEITCNGEDYWTCMKCKNSVLHASDIISDIAEEKQKRAYFFGDVCKPITTQVQPLPFGQRAGMSVPYDNSEPQEKCTCLGCSSGERCTKEIRIDKTPAQNTPEIVHKPDDMSKECAEWEKRFAETKFAKGGGSCFECCDYEGMYNELKSFISSLLSAKDQEIQESNREVYDTAHNLGMQEGAKEERERILEILRKERDAWIKNSSGDNALSSLEEAIRFFN